MFINVREQDERKMRQTFEKNIMEVESRADSQLSMIYTHGTPSQDLDEFE